MMGLRWWSEEVRGRDRETVFLKFISGSEIHIRGRVYRVKIGKVRDRIIILEIGRYQLSYNYFMWQKEGGYSAVGNCQVSILIFTGMEKIISNNKYLSLIHISEPTRPY